MFRLETQRLILREMRADDATALLEVFSDPLVMASFPGTPPFDSIRMDAWVGRNLAHQREHGYGLFSVIHKEDGVLIGDCGLERMGEPYPGRKRRFASRRAEGRNVSRRGGGPDRRRLLGVRDGT